MILHEVTSRRLDTSVFSWWAVDADTLTLARCTIRNRYRLRLDIVRPEATVPMVTSVPYPPDVGDAAIAHLFGCRFRFKHLADAPGLLGAASHNIVIPEYILLGNRGIPHAILHTPDPVFIASYIDGRVNTPMGNLLAFRSNVDLPPSGWDYWNTDAYQEFERMSLRYTERWIPLLESCI